MHSSVIHYMENARNLAILQKIGTVNEMANLTYIVSTYPKNFPVKKYETSVFIYRTH